MKAGLKALKHTQLNSLKILNSDCISDYINISPVFERNGAQY